MISRTRLAAFAAALALAAAAAEAHGHGAAGLGVAEDGYVLAPVYRAFADFSGGGRSFTLASDLLVAGPFRPVPLPAPSGPRATRGATFPSPGRYRLFLQFKHDGRLHTVAHTVEVHR